MTTPLPPNTPVRPRSWLAHASRVALGAVFALVVIVVVTLGGAWWWTGTEGSLAWTLQSLATNKLLYRWASTAGVPVGQVTATDVTGSLRRGGRVGGLTWQQAMPTFPLDATPSVGMVLDAQGLQLQWNVPALLRGELHITQLEAQRLQLTLPANKEPTVPPQSVTLPLPVNANFKVQQLQLQGAMTAEVRELAGHYAYGLNKGAARHALQISTLTIAQGQYTLDAAVDAQFPMAIQASASGRVASAVPGGVGLTVLADAKVNGTLAGAQAALDVQAQVRPAAPKAEASQNTLQSTPQKAPQKTPPPPGPTLQATARVLPWSPQPLHSTSVTLERFNLVDFWPQAPATDLSGTVSAQPQGDGWAGHIALRNGAPGPWDRQRLPLDSLTADVAQHGEPSGGQWVVSALQAHGANGSLQAEGQWTPPGAAPAKVPNAAPWTGQLRFSGINPAALYSSLDPTRIEGHISAKALTDTTGSATVFDATVKPTAPTSRIAGVALGNAHAAGVWREGSLQLNDLTLQAAQATLQAKGTLKIAARAFDGTADLRFPGGAAQFSGQLDSGAGPAAQGAKAKEDRNSAHLSLTQADTALAWLRGLPKVAPYLSALEGWRAQGQADVALRWQGRNAASPVSATLVVPQLVLQAPTAADGVRPAPLQLRQWQVSAQGPWSDLALQVDGVAEQAPLRATLSGQAVAHFKGLPLSVATASGTLDISRLQAQLQDSTRRLAGSVQAEGPLQGRWGDGNVEALPGQLRVRPLAFEAASAKGSAVSAGPAATAPKMPAIDPVTLRWEQLRWGADGLRTQGTLSQLSLAWVDWLAGPTSNPLADVGLSGQVWFDGDWDVLWPRDARSTVRLNAGLQRQRGDVRLAVDDGTQTQQVAAGLREASVRISTGTSAENSDQNSPMRLPVKLKLLWKSEQAGQVTAEINTQLQAGGGLESGSQGGSEIWPANAPLSGQLNAQLPQIGAWSLLAPPGWRMKGTLATQATINGTRSAPQWAGQVQADQLALRSVVDGIEFINGQLRASLQGDKVVIERFALDGAGGAKAGGSLEASGSAQWALETPPATAATAATSSLPPKQPRRVPHIDLQVKLDKLRVSSRADRRLVVSGQAQAQLAGARLLLRGKLRADQAAITLPDELSPRLGDDVVVRGHAGTTSPSTAPQVVPDVLLDLDLGDNFAVEGSGLKARLQGTLQVRSTAAQPAPRLLGEVRTTSGSYRAYGVNLNLETGLLRFNGPLDNPSLDILAIRPNISQRVGVQVNGTALAPIVRLYAEPELPDSEKLSWVVLGRSAAGPGGEAAILQQAAMSLLGRPGNQLGGGIAGALGLDELSYRSGGVNADGSVTTAAVSVGKRLSSKLYVVYGQSLTGSVGTVSILYDLSKRLTLRAKAGEENVLELVFTQRYD